VARARMAREAGRTTDAIDFMRKVTSFGMLLRHEGELYAAAFKVAMKELLAACQLIDQFSAEKVCDVVLILEAWSTASQKCGGRVYRQIAE